jgi:hypothetical protein
MYELKTYLLLQSLHTLIQGLLTHQRCLKLTRNLGLLDLQRHEQRTKVYKGASIQGGQCV